MRLRNSLQVMRRWRAIIGAGVLMGVVVGWVSAPGTRATATTYGAKHTLISDPLPEGGYAGFPAVLRATLGPVPTRVAARLGIDRRVVQSLVSADTEGGAVVILGRSTNPAEAEALANITAEELLVELGGPKSGLRTLEPAVARPIETGDVQGPSSRAGRAILLGAFGLFLGVGGAFAVDRFDNRVRSKGSAEEALGAPVLAEVPSIPRSDHGGVLLTGSQPSQFVEAFRRLRTSVDRWTAQTATGEGPRIIVVTSPSGGEGTTTTVAHLAAMLGELGRSVVVISGDLRRPRLHLYFNRAGEPGLVDVLKGAPDARRLSDLDLATTIRGIRFVASGAPVRNPAPLLGQVGDHLRDARTLGDVVLIDAPPLLTTSEAADLAQHADGVLLVVRAGRTSVGATGRCAELLQRLSIPVLGAVLVAAPRHDLASRL